MKTVYVSYSYERGLLQNYIKIIINLGATSLAIRNKFTNNFSKIENFGFLDIRTWIKVYNEISQVNPFIKPVGIIVIPDELKPMVSNTLNFNTTINNKRFQLINDSQYYLA